MDRARVLAEIAAAQAGPGELLYLERSGADYRWRLMPAGVLPASASPASALPAGPGQQPGEPAPDAWMFYTGPWPEGPPAGLADFAEELLAEMESMCGGADRCRWPLDQPYPMRH